MTRIDERGQLSAFVALLVVPLMAVIGLVADGGGILTSHELAVSSAFEAARAGAQAIDLDALRATGQVRLDPVLARSQALAFLSSTGQTGSVSVVGDTVTVTITSSHHLAVLSAIGIGPVTVRGTASATATQGVTGAGQ